VSPAIGPCILKGNAVPVSTVTRLVLLKKLP